MTKESTLPKKGSHIPTKTVLVLGASYGGHKAIQQLVSLLPSSWRVVALERNSHFNHLYAFPRMSVISGHEHKIFVPYSKLFEPRDSVATSRNNSLIQGSLVSLSHSTSTDDQLALGRGVATYQPLDGDAKASSESKQIRCDYLVYALGSQLPPPINIWSTSSKSQEVFSKSQKKEAKGQTTNGNSSSIGVTSSAKDIGSKAAGIHWLKEAQGLIRDAQDILVIGAGALGVQYASDIAWTYGTPSTSSRWNGHLASDTIKPKKITLLSSSPRILPRFQPWMHEEGVRSLKALGVDVITGSRADMSSLKEDQKGQKRIIKTMDGRNIEADVVLFCTGQRPNTRYLESFGDVIDSTSGMARVTPRMQLALPSSQIDVNHIFVIGDAADAFGALNAGHNATEQAEIATRNIARLVLEEDLEAAKESNDLPEWINSPLESYKPSPDKIKVSMGLDKAINENNGNHKILTNVTEDLNAANLWLRRGLSIDDMTV